MVVADVAMVADAVVMKRKMIVAVEERAIANAEMIANVATERIRVIAATIANAEMNVTVETIARVVATMIAVVTTKKAVAVVALKI